MKYVQVVLSDGSSYAFVESDISIDPVENAVVVDRGQGIYIKFYWPGVKYFGTGDTELMEDDDDEEE